MAKNRNGEFRGAVRTEIRYIKEQVDRQQIQLEDIEKKVNYIHNKVTALETRAAIVGGIAGLVITIIITNIIPTIF